MDTLMSEALLMSSQPTLLATPNAISSPVSEAGPTPSNSLDGPQIVQCGPEAAPASHSAQPEKDSLRPTSATSGLSSSTSSVSAALSMSLGSRLQARLGTAGSMEYRQTWKRKATPAGRPYWAHIPSTRPINDSGSTGWPTPKAQEDGSTPEQYEARRQRAYANRKGKTSGGPSGKQGGLAIAAQLTGWTTPDARAMNDGENLETWDARQAKNKEKHGNGNGAGMPIAIQCKTIVGWCSPTVTDAARGVMPPRPQDTGIPLTQQVAGLTGWPTPMKKDGENYGGVRDKNSPMQTSSLPMAVRFGLNSPSSTAETEKSVASQLNPHFSRWLMGFPPEWCDCAVTAMQSFPSVRKSSSKRS